VLSVITDDGSTESGSLIDEIVREGARRLPAAALEAEVNQYIAELAAETDEAGRRLLVRNGHHRPAGARSQAPTRSRPRGRQFENGVLVERQDQAGRAAGPGRMNHHDAPQEEPAEHLPSRPA
jgi:hypothetical protein